MPIDYKKALNEEQYTAVTTTEGPVLILAGAGSGKTHTLIYRVAYLIEQGVNPQSILLLTFTNKAADEMRRRAASLLDERCKHIVACTYHSFCATNLRSYGHFANINENFVILSASDVKDAIGLCKSECGYSGIRGFPTSKTIADLISKAINTEQDLYDVLQDIANEAPKFESFITPILDIAAEYKRYKEERGYLDYDDLLTKFLDVLTEHPKIAAHISRQYKYIMIDEYQDSNNIQESIIRELRTENKNLAVVGDDMQSLYGFRGANVKNIIHFPDRWPNCQTIKLTENYRSDDNILKLANTVVENCATEGIQKTLKGQFETSIMPKIIITDNEMTEASAILRLIKEAIDEGADPETFAILERRGMESNMLEAMMETERIPYKKYGGLKFMERTCIMDMVALLRILASPYDELAWFRVLKLYEGIAKGFAQKLSNLAHTSGYDMLDENPYKKRKFAESLKEFKSWIQSTKNEEYQDVMRAASNYYFDLRYKTLETMNTTEEKRDELSEQLEDAKRDVETLIELSKNYPSLNEFLDAIAVDAAEKDNEKNAVTISTIHSAKGLEFSVVFILNCVDGKFPSTTFLDEGTTEDNEELRCFYVAMTRAKHELICMCPSSVRKNGREYLKTEISHFLTNASERYQTTYL